VPRDAVRLQVVDATGVASARVRDLPAFLRRGDLLVANRSALRPAAVHARIDDPPPGVQERILVHFAHRYGPGAWLAELRVDEANPGPLPLPIGTRLRMGEAEDAAPLDAPLDAPVDATVLAPYPGLPRLRFLRTDGEPTATAPVRYGHVRGRPPLQAYATIFGDRPGSAEMASAGRPFTASLLQALRTRGVQLVRITLHAGVSSLDAPADDARLIVPAEAFEVDAATAGTVNDALGEGRRVVAIGTGAVRALESAWDGHAVRPVRGWTRRVLTPGRSGRFLSGLITGLHGPEASHLRLLLAMLGTERVQQAYRAAAEADLAAHEFGDLQLIWR